MMRRSIENRIAALERTSVPEGEFVHIIEHIIIEPILDPNGIPIGGRPIKIVGRNGEFLRYPTPEDVEKHSV